MPNVNDIVSLLFLFPRGLFFIFPECIGISQLFRVLHVSFPVIVTHTHLSAQCHNSFNLHSVDSD